MQKSKRLILNGLLTFILVTTSHYSSAQNQLLSPKNVEFYDEFINSVPELKLPLTYECGFKELILSEELQEKLQPFTPAGYKIIGKVSIHARYNILIMGEIVGMRYIPFIFVTDNEGTTISTICLETDSCQSNSNFTIKYSINTGSNAQISVNSQLVYTDQTNKASNPIQTTFEITNKGLIKKKVSKN